MSRLASRGVAKLGRRTGRSRKDAPPPCNCNHGFSTTRSSIGAVARFRHKVAPSEGRAGRLRKDAIVGRSPPALAHRRDLAASIDADQLQARHDENHAKRLQDDRRSAVDAERRSDDCKKPNGDSVNPEIGRQRSHKEIITLGASDPEMISLMGFFEEDARASRGRDKI